MKGRIVNFGHEGDPMIIDSETGKKTFLRGYPKNIKIGDRVVYLKTGKPDKSYFNGRFEKKLKPDTKDYQDLYNNENDSIISTLIDIKDDWNEKLKAVLENEGNKVASDNFLDGIIFGTKKYLSGEEELFEDYINCMIRFCEKNNENIIISQIQNKFKLIKDKYNNPEKYKKLEKLDKILELYNLH